jgi:hypothetical protein
MTVLHSRHRRIRRRLLAGGIFLTGIAAAGGAAAPAAQASPASGQISWSVAPASSKAPDSRTLFSYQNVKPGSSISDHVAVLNRSNQAVAFSIYATDATGTTAKDALTLLPANKKPTDIGSWATFPGHSAQLSIVIPGGKGIIEPFTITVPRNATPGDHVGGMIASVGVPTRNAHGQVFTLYQRIAVPLEVRVTGELHAALQVEQISAGIGHPVNPFGSGSVSVTYSVVNTGNVKLTGTQVVTITGPFGAKFTLRPHALPVVLPGDSIRYTVSAGGVYPAGPVDARVSVTPRWPANTVPLATALTLASGSTSLFAMPWALIVLVILLVGGGYGFWRTLRWRRRVHQDDIAYAAERARRETEHRLLGGTDGNSASAPTPLSGEPRAGASDTGNQPK